MKKKCFFLLIFLIFCFNPNSFKVEEDFKRKNDFYWTLGNGFRGYVADNKFDIIRSSIISNELAIAKIKSGNLIYISLMKKIKEDQNFFIIRIKDIFEQNTVEEPYQYFYPWDTKCGIVKKVAWIENGSEIFLVKFNFNDILPEIVKIWGVDTKSEKIVQLDKSWGHCNYIIP